VRISIRYKILFMVAALVLAAVLAYLSLAVRLLTEDKLAYVYDQNSTMVGALAEETGLYLTLLREKLDLVALQAYGEDVDDDAREELIEAFLQREKDLVRLEIQAAGDDGAFRRELVRLAGKRLNDMQVAPGDLLALREKQPIPKDVVSGDGLFIRNASLPPDAAMFTVAIAIANSPDGKKRMFVADVRQDRLLRAIGGSKIYTTYVVDERGEVLLHPDAKLLAAKTRYDNRPIVTMALAGGMEQGAREFDDPNGERLIGAFSRSGVAGVTVISEVSRAQALKAADELVRRSVFFGIAIFFAAFVVSIFFSRRITGPLTQLGRVTQRIGAGEFDAEVNVRSRDEVGDLANALRAMSQALKDTNAKLVQSEKMAAFGQLGAGITHEVKNPLGGILGMAQLAQKKMDDPKKLAHMLQVIEKESKRARDIVNNFLRFARSDAGVLDVVDLNPLVTEGLELARHQLSINKVKLNLDLGEGLPQVRINPGQIQQVLLNLALNAQQAMPEGGEVTIRTRPEGDGVAIFVQDTGPGIPEEIRARIFEPFFTTKPAGEGTGLGLAVTFGIIRDHHGKVVVEGGPGEGAIFHISLPPASAVPDPVVVSG
jgi:signal transduction histidine kinase